MARRSVLRIIRRFFFSIDIVIAIALSLSIILSSSPITVTILYTHIYTQYVNAAYIVNELKYCSIKAMLPKNGKAYITPQQKYYLALKWKWKIKIQKIKGSQKY